MIMRATKTGSLSATLMCQVRFPPIFNTMMDMYIMYIPILIQKEKAVI